MAKARSALKVIRVPSFPRRRGGAMVRRGVSGVARQAQADKHRIGALVGAAALGYIKKSRTKLPIPAGMPPALFLGIACMMGARFLKSKALDHAATGLLSVAAHEWAEGSAMASSSVEGEGDIIEGEFDEAV